MPRTHTAGVTENVFSVELWVRRVQGRGEKGAHGGGRLSSDKGWIQGVTTPLKGARLKHVHHVTLQCRSCANLVFSGSGLQSVSRVHLDSPLLSNSSWGRGAQKNKKKSTSGPQVISQGSGASTCSSLPYSSQEGRQVFPRKSGASAPPPSRGSWFLFQGRRVADHALGADHVLRRADKPLSQSGSIRRSRGLVCEGPDSGLLRSIEREYFQRKGV